MFEIARRLLWYGPTLALFASLWFAALAQAIPDPGPHFASVLSPTPVTLDSEVARVTAALFRGDESAKREIHHLGAAAIPLYLKVWHGYSLREQKLLAEALEPVLFRMGVLEEDEHEVAHLDQEAAELERLLALKRFEEERLSELHPVAVSRLVKRLSGSDYRARLSDLRLADTYALSYLIAELGRVDSQKDAQRVQRILRFVQRLLPELERIAPPKTIEESRLVATLLRREWDHEAAQFSNATALNAVVLPLAQSEFTVFLRRTAREFTGLDTPTETKRLSELAKQSALPTFGYLCGALFLSPLLAALTRLLQLRTEMSFTRRLIVPRARYVLAALLAFSCVTLARPRPGPSGLFLLLLVVGAIQATFVLDRDLNDRMDYRTEFLLSRRSFSRQLQAIARLVGPTIPTLLPLLIAEGFLSLTVVEHFAKAPGLGFETVAAIRRGDRNYLFLLSLLLSLLTSFVHLLGDATLNPFTRLRRPR